MWETETLSYNRKSLLHKHRMVMAGAEAYIMPCCIVFRPPQELSDEVWEGDSRIQKGHSVPVSAFLDGRLNTGEDCSVLGRIYFGVFRGGTKCRERDGFR